ncbi:UMF1 family MFS transporter [Homoserinimonas aerilata]|uniref:UMF1 family MFS transporter n=1 Tax=Homoserinimonas aerilata TaxID=1162970 RepID=A0A542YF56_9MICO|nr:MFS transporter [Homoserinimonas aerilata]TQL46728.1 UMF1 family MFS transporter [Homoserinimonas aerilata]
MSNESPDGDTTGSDVTATSIHVPAAANSGAIGAMGRDLPDGEHSIPRKQVFSWALWDWATQPFNSVILTFVFVALYLVGDSFIDPAIVALGTDSADYKAASAALDSQFGFALFIGGLFVAVLAPVMGQRGDSSGNRKRWLLINTLLLIVCMALLFFVEAAPAYFVLGISLVSAGSVFSEIAGVHYNAMLAQVSTRRTVGKVSGLGWGFGYLGGIVALVIVVIVTQLDWFGMDTSNGMAYRIIALGCAVWAIAFSIPIMLNVSESAGRTDRPKVGFLRSYVVLGHDVARIFRTSRSTFWFLIASAIYRDGLAGVFAFGAIIAAKVFGFSNNEVLIFGIVANLVAGISTILSGRLDDRFGARAVIMTALGGLIVASLVVFFLHDQGVIVFWVVGLVLCMFVGPAQASSRSLLARLAPAGHEGEIFGLYATTGRAASFMAPGLWALFTSVFVGTHWGILGIAIVLLVGFVFMLFVRTPQHVRG